MTVLMGNTANDVALGADGRPLRGLIVTLFTDKARTTPATGLTEEDGVTQSDSAAAGYAPASNRVPGSTITSKVMGVLSFGAPDGTTRLYYDRGDGVSAVLLPRADLAYAPIGSVGGGIGYDTDGVPYVKG